MRQGIGVLGMKPIGSRMILNRTQFQPWYLLCMNLPTSVVITGCDNMQVLEQALEVEQRSAH